MSNREIETTRNKEVEDRIAIRSPLSIYAFRTNTIPAYLKVGDTFRPVDTRIAEWEKKLKINFHDIQLTQEGNWPAMVDGQDVYFRDYEIHDIFVTQHKERLSEEEQKLYSKEFFKDVTGQDVKNAIDTVKNAYNDETTRIKYHYYKLEDRRPSDFQYQRNENWTLRKNQNDVVDTFEKKVNEGKNKLLMYAVMRFGKSFTAISCAQRMGYKKVLVVSAKADVAGEWKKTVEKPKCFDKFKFLTDNDFRNDKNAINTWLTKNDTECVVAFLTLQNLSGKGSDGEDIKDRLEGVLQEEFDLLIIDETHYGAWADKYGAPIKDKDKKEEDYETIENELKEHEDFYKKSNSINAKVKLHLSGTPYSLLYDNEFDESTTIATCQFSDILAAKQEWDEQHFDDIENEVINPDTDKKYEEYDNPYFGFPKMLRFGFNLPAKTREKLKQYKKEGVSWSLRDFLTVGSDKKFVFEEDVIHLLKTIDGTESEDGILGFLNLEKIKKNDVCKHIVIALPFKKSCDAMEKLLQDLKDEFANLCNYTVLNVAGNKVKKALNTVDKVKTIIADNEKEGQKTITLTVNKMLTGVTVKEWDTMIMLKSTRSAQEYDQAVFRIQNQYVKEEIDEQGNVLFKKDMKPQTILVDFDPIRVLEVQGRAASIIKNYTHSDNTLDELIEREIQFLPTMVYYANTLVEVTPTNVLEVLVHYNRERSIMDMASKITLAESIKNNEKLLEYIKKQSEKGVSSNSLKFDAHKGDTEKDVSDDVGVETKGGDSDTTDTTDKETKTKLKDDNVDVLEKKYRNCIAKIYFYAFLSESKLSDLDDVLKSIEENEDNKRIFDNLGLDKGFIKGLIDNCSKLYLDDINREIIHIQRLAEDEDLTSEERVANAMKRFSVIGSAEVVTPQNICKDMLTCIGEDKLIEIVNSGGKILDIASKTGEFSIALFNLLKEKVDTEKLKNAIYAIPTSSCTYEFTRKTFESAGLNLENLAENITSYSLLEYKKKDRQGREIKELDYDKICEVISNEFKREGETEMIKFEAVVGNPPYQEESKVDSAQNGQNPRTNIFHFFQIQANKIATKYTVMIYPGARWIHQCGKGLSIFGKEQITNNNLEKLIFYPKATEVFDKSGIDDGISIVFNNKSYNSDTFEYEFIEDNNTKKIICAKPQNELFILNPNDNLIINKIKDYVKKNSLVFLCDSILSRSLFNIDSDFVEKNPTAVRLFNEDSVIDYEKEIKLFTNDKAGSAGRGKWYIVKKELVTSNINYISEWQVIVSSAHPGGQHNRDNMIEIADNHSAFGRTRVALKSFNSEEKAKNFYKYCNSYLIKYAFLMTDESLTSLAKMVPDLGDYSNANKYIDYSKDINKQLFDLFGITNKDDIDYIVKKIDDNRPLKN